MSSVAALKGPHVIRSIDMPRLIACLRGGSSQQAVFRFLLYPEIVANLTVLDRGDPDPDRRRARIEHVR